jgi:TRAP-type mannitol/chloroaromatic compound transport system permease small subunit
MPVIDRINEWITRAVSWLIPLLVVELVYDTAARYLFNAPTAWSYDISYMLYGAVFMLAAGHTLHLDKHVRIETFYGRASLRARALIDAIGYLVFFFPVVGALVYFGSAFAYKSWSMWEAGGESMWQPPIYPFKTVLPVAAVLLFAQGLSEFSRSVILLLRGADANRQS